MMQKKDYYLLFSVLALVTISRFVPHPPNFSPMASLALFSGLFFIDKRLAFAIPLSVMVVSDLFLGLHSLLPFVYLGMACTVAMGIALHQHFKWSTSLLAVFASSLLFFLLTNFGVWFVTDMYPSNFSGLLACYIAAIPFFQNSVMGNCFFSLILLGGYALAYRQTAVNNAPQ